MISNKCWWEYEKLELLHHQQAGKTVPTSERGWHFLKSLNTELARDPSVLLLDPYPKETETRLHKNLPVYVHSGTIRNSWKVETTQMSINNG